MFPLEYQGDIVSFKINEQINNGRNDIKYTLHALERLIFYQIDVEQFGIILRSEYELLEEYPDDPRGTSALLLIKVNSIVIHVVVAPHESSLIIITAYLPDPSRWDKDLKRRKKT